VDRRKDIILAVPAKRRWTIAVVPNKYPAVSVTNRRAYGIQEVVIETPDPQKQLEELGERHIAQLLQIYAERTVAVTQIPNIEYVLIFKNSGGRAGASLTHSHSQIFATALVPPHLSDKSQKMKEYTRVFGSCVYCDVIRIESRGPRFVYRDGGVVAFTPFASMHNYEIWILPLRHIDNVTDLTARERFAWARILRKVLHRIGELGLPYNYYFHQIARDRDQHLYMKVTPRGSVWAGVEVGSGVILNPVAPEDAARYYRAGI
jgi:UDPglucose--hexose-1-phosphate uridylyltransferase